MTKRSVPRKSQAAGAVTKPPLAILDAALDPDIWNPWFRNVKTWSTWFVFLRAVFGLPLDEADLAIFQKFTSRSHR